MARRQHHDVSVPLCSPPSARLLSMRRFGRHKYICLLVIQRHKIMFILQCEWRTPVREWMSFMRFDRDGALFGMMSKYASQQATQHRFLGIVCGPRMYGEQSVPVADIILECRLDGFCHPLSSLC